MNQIAEKQNQEKYLQYLAAQRQLYNEDKKWAGIFLIFPIIIAILGNLAFAMINWVVIPPLVTWITWLYAIGELFVFPDLTSSKRKNAAKIQELFDCEILELPWNDALGAKTKPETIVKAYRRFKKKCQLVEWERLKNWYTHPDLNKMSLAQARIACQKENIWWDSGQRRDYARGVITATGLLFAVLITVGIIANWSLQQFFQGPLALSLPVVILGLKHGYSHIKAAKRLDNLLDRVNELRRMASESGVDDAKITQQSRDLQTEIFHHRSENLPVFSWYYDKLRDKYEQISREANKLA